MSLENDLQNLKNFVELDDKNFDTFSMEIFKLLQLSCSEIDSVCRVLCNQIDQSKDFHDETTYSGKINLYRETIITKFPKLPTTQIIIPGPSSPVKPWEDWIKKNSPYWWVGYNKSKHYRHSSYEQANLKNMLMSMAGLMILILYLYRSVSGQKKDNPSPLPKFFKSKYTSPILAIEPENELPDFE
jgi:hypothetical protein